MNVYFTQHRDDCNNAKTRDDVFLVIQYFVHKDKERFSELTECLKKNIKIGLFKNIFALNERLYTRDEMGLTEDEFDRVVQIDTKGERLRYRHFFDFVEEQKMKGVKGYFVLANTDIFFDESISNLRRSCLHEKKSVYALLRHEWDGSNSELFKMRGTPVPGSQDVWCVHTNHAPFPVGLKQRSDFYLGVLGCDNTIAYLLHVYGYDCINEPCIVKTYHNHKSQKRNTDTWGKTIRRTHYLFPVPIVRLGDGVKHKTVVI